MKEQFGSLEVRLSTTESERYLTITRKMMVFDERAGPMDTIQLVIDSKLQYTVYLYCRVTEINGSLSVPEDIRQLPVINNMVNSNWIVCAGVSEYSKYRSSIGFDVKGVVAVSLPPDSVQHKDCSKFFEKSKTQKSKICKACLSLKYYLSSRKRKYDAMTSFDRQKRQETSSHVPYDNLSPDSKKLRLSNLRYELSSARNKIRRLNQRIARIDLNEEQDKELSQLVQCISSSDAGQQELDRIFQEADDTSSGKGAMLKNLWDNDVGTFYDDQRKNGMSFWLYYYNLFIS